MTELFPHGPISRLVWQVVSAEHTQFTGWACEPAAVWFGDAYTLHRYIEVLVGVGEKEVLLDRHVECGLRNPAVMVIDNTLDS